VSRVFYRVIKGPVPTLDDFKTHKQLGIPLKNKALEREWGSAISVYDEFDYVVGIARRFPRLGSHIATIVVPEDGSVEFAQTMGDEHHYSIYKSAQKVLELVVGESMPVPKEIKSG
jgi:hypothetical protein